MLSFKCSMFYLSMETRKIVKNCDQGNALDDINCYKDFVTDKIGCSIPWHNHSASTKDPCKTSEELKKYLNLRLEMAKDKHQEALEGKGCISRTLTNCHKKHWPYQDGGQLGNEMSETLNAIFQLSFNISSNDIQVYMFIPKRIVRTHPNVTFQVSKTFFYITGKCC